MVEERCIHELILGQCADCAPIPHGLSKVVYLTKGGSVFHRSPTCEALIEGQRKAARFGKETHDPQPVPLREAQAMGRGACIPCFPDFVPPQAKPCWVQHGTTWLPGFVLEWRRDPTTRRWQGVVSYAADGEQITTTRDQRHLRPRKRPS
ncbi:hypothetical protein [Nonomuraea sp. NPDC049028]|uniref:hypothetical protein n=1 Tax=Nonomuraea sp. NPDC049028 TaxID=3364348 RepID=UPI003722F084